MNIRFNDLSRLDAFIKQEIDLKIYEIIHSDDYIYNPIVYEFEAQLAQYLGVKHAITVASGTDALIFALIAAGIGREDEVITTGFSFFSTAAAIIHAGGLPVFVDIDPVTFNICPDLIEASITKKTKAIIPVHLFGQPADMKRIIEIADKNKLFIIEDASQAIGSSFQGNKVATFGLAGCISFNYSKNLGAYGNGGAVVTNDDRLAKEIIFLRNYGLDGYFHHTRLGFNSNLGAIQAGVLNIKLKFLDDWNTTRQELAQHYSSSLSNISQVVLPVINKNFTHVYNKFSIITDKRDELQGFLMGKGIETKVFYPEPLHLQPCFKPFNLLYQNGCHLKVAEETAQKVLSLPLFPGMKEDEINFVIHQVIAFFSLMN